MVMGVQARSLDLESIQPHSWQKGRKKWRKGLLLGKTDGQDAYIVYDGDRVLLARSIRRVNHGA